MHYATIQEPGRLNRAFGKNGSLERQKNLCLGRSTGFSIRIQNFPTDTDAVSSRLKKEQKITICNGRGILIASLAGKSTFSGIFLKEPIPHSALRKGTLIPSFNTNSLS